MNLLKGCVGWWKFNEGAGASAIDALFGHVLALSNASWAVGKIGKALDFDYTSEGNAYLASPNDMLRMYGSMSISAWLYVNNYPNTGQICSCEGDGVLVADDSRYSAWVSATTGIVNLGWRLSNGTTFVSAASSEAIGKGAWKHVIITRTVAATTTVNFYFNNATKGSTGSLTNPTSDVGSGAPFNVGGNKEYTDTHSVVTTLDGLIDNIALWNRVLTSNERGWLFKNSYGIERLVEAGTFVLAGV